MEAWFDRRIVEKNGHFQCIAESTVYGCMPYWFSDWYETAETSEAEFFSARGAILLGFWIFGWEQPNAPSQWRL